MPVPVIFLGQRLEQCEGRAVVQSMFDLVACDDVHEFSPLLSLRTRKLEADHGSLAKIRGLSRANSRGGSGSGGVPGKTCLGSSAVEWLRFASVSALDPSQQAAIEGEGAAAVHEQRQGQRQ